MLLNALPLFLGKIGTGEIIVLVLLIVIFFGGRKIPELMRGMGRGIKEFKDAMNKDYTPEDKANNTTEENKPQKQ